ncbi:MAG: hypothetical protein PHP44_06670 [Kiritimatiellae bacterium]|nr:hypothetical protein [Kiritimatiellia bacterium]
MIRSEMPSELLSTPQSLEMTLGWAMYSVSADLNGSSAPARVLLVNETGVPAEFIFETGESIAYTRSQEWKIGEAILIMTDAEGWATTNDPAFYNLYPGNGECFSFVADKDSPDYMSLYKYENAQGKKVFGANTGWHVIRTAGGILKQVRGPSLFADIVTISDIKYELRLYTLDSISSYDAANRRYDILSGKTPIEVWSFENPEQGNINHFRASKTIGESTQNFDYIYVEAVEDWTLIKGGGLQIIKKESMRNDDHTERFESYIVTDSEDQMAEKSVVHYKEFAWGESWYRKIVGFDDVELIDAYAYYENPADLGRYSLMKLQSFASGDWELYDYFANGYDASESSPWMDSAPTDSMVKASISDYTPHDSTDTPGLNDRRPRTVTEKIGDIVTAITYFSYPVGDNRETFEIEEKASVQNASYGDASNLRTVKTYYGTNVQNYLTGRLKSVQYPDGRLDTHIYEYGFYTTNANPALSAFTPDTEGSAWCVSITHSTVESPGGIPGKSTKEVTVYDAVNNKALEEVYVCTEAGFERIQWTVKSFDVFGHTVAEAKSDGTLQSATWGTGCCGMDNKTEADGSEFVYSYDALGRAIAEVKIATTGTTSRIVAREYNADGKVLRQEITGGSLSLSAQSVYDGAGRIAEQINEQGISTRYAYEEGGRIRATINADRTNTVERYRDGRTKSVSNNGVLDQSYIYGVNTDGTTWTMTYQGPEGTNSPAWTKTTSDMIGRIIKTEKTGFSGSIVETCYVYNTLGQMSSVQNISGDQTNTVLYTYNELGERILTVQDVNGNGEVDFAGSDRISETRNLFYENIAGDWYAVNLSISYPENSATPVTNQITRNRLTGLGTTTPHGILVREAIQQDRLGNQTIAQTHLDRANKVRGSLVDTPDSTQNITETVVNGLLSQAVSAQSVTNTFAYDALERRVATEQHSGTNRLVGIYTHYNTIGQVDYTQDAAGNRTTYTYDDYGRRIAVTDALSNTTHTAYDAFGRMIAQWGATYPVAYEYDDSGRMTAMLTTRDSSLVITNDSSFIIHHSSFDRTSWFYDPSTGLLTNKVYADGQGTAYTYTPEGKLASRTWARGVVTEYTYDTLGQLTNINYSDTTPDVTYTYNRMGQQLTITDALGTRTNEYNALGQLTAEMLPDGTSLARSNDSFGRPSGIALDSDYTLTYGYDEYGRFSSVSSSVLSVSSVVNYSHLPNSSLLESKTISSDGNSVLDIGYSYDPNRDLIIQIQNTAGTNLISQFDYLNDAVGRRTSRSDQLLAALSAVQTNLFDYNLRSELIEAAMGTNDYQYEYDPIGNRRVAVSSQNAEVSTNLYVANELNQYLAITSSLQSTVYSLSHDPDGNLTNANGWTFTWDAENRLLTASNGTTVVHNTYDYMSRRIRKETLEGETLTSRTFIYDGWNLLSEVSSQNSEVSTNYYVWGLDLSGTLQGAGGVGGLLFMLSSDSRLLTPAFDANGNITDYLDTNGTLVAHYQYDPYGNITHAQGAMADSMPYRFSTKYLDTETDLYYYGYRFYSPEMGRWVSSDPIGDPAFIPFLLELEIAGDFPEDELQNLSCFSKNTPVNSWDLLGLACTTTRQKIYDFTIPTRSRKEYKYGNWTLVDAQDHGYNDLIGYIYVCVWERDRTIKKYRQYKRFYAYLVITICVCPNSVHTSVDDGTAESEKLVSTEKDKQYRKLQFNAPIPLDPRSFCSSEGPPK